MKTTRRECFRYGAAAAVTLAGVASLSSCRSIEQTLTHGEIDQPEMAILSSRPELMLLQRATYGPISSELREVERIGAAAWIDRQLDPDSIDEPLVLTVRIRPLGDVLNADPGILFDTDDRVAVRTVRQATTLRAVYSRRQLYERMVGFWTDHFNIYAFKGEGAQYKVIDDRDTIRPHALGRFRDLLGASARSAAMLGYLDNAVNRKGVANENYARELMELHTLGVNSGYTQRDVQQVARCFTGWTTEKHWHRGRFLFDESSHDSGAKVVLGRTIPAGGGISDGEQVLDMVASHPATASHISRMLCLYFLGSVPDSLHRQLATTFLQTGGQIKPVVRQLLNAPELATAPPLLKRPFEYVASALRGLGADTDGGADLQSHFDAMGDSPFAWPMPDGYPMREQAWVSGMIPRWKFAAALAGDRIGNTSVDWQGVLDTTERRGLSPAEACVESLFSQTVAAFPRVRTAIRQCAGGDMSLAAAIAMMSPEFQYR